MIFESFRALNSLLRAFHFPLTNLTQTPWNFHIFFKPIIRNPRGHTCLTLLARQRNRNKSLP